MVKHKKLGMAVAGAFALCGASAAHAFNVKAGDWDLSVAGEVNAFYTYNHCDNNANTVVGGFACVTSQTNQFSSIESGLLPSAIVFSAKTTQEGFDLGVTFGFYPGISSTGNGALQGSFINMRQNFFTFGDKDMGTIKMGRDLGIFGSDAILSDLTLLGVGAPAASPAPGTTTLGRIGFGYIYADWLSQITYITPSWDGLQLSAGVFQPMVMTSAPFGGGAGATLNGHSMPMFQAKGTYDFSAMDVKGRAWVGGLMQRSMANIAAGDALALSATNRGITAEAGEAGVKASVAGFDAVLYAYQARGVGTTGLFTGGFNGANGNKRNSDGGYAQLQYSIGKWKPGISYGFSRLTTAASEVNPTLVNFNRLSVAQLQYSLTKALTLVGEYGRTTSSSQVSGIGGGGKNLETSFSAGAIIFF